MNTKKLKKSDKKSYFQLKTLTMQNFATFEQQTIQFVPGLNVMVGETGSGKSLIMDALAIVLGQRAGKKLVRAKAAFAVLEATFSVTCPSLRTLLEEKGFPLLEDGELVIKRILSPEGKTKNFMNWQSCSLGAIQEITRNYVDLVGQFENQRLLQASYQLDIFDEFAGLEQQRSAYEELYEQWQEQKLRLSTLEQQQRDVTTKSEYHAFVLKELQDFSPQLGEEEQLIAKKKILLQQEELQLLFGKMEQLLGLELQEPGTLTDNMHQLRNLIVRHQALLGQELSDHLSRFDEAFDQLLQSQEKIKQQLLTVELSESVLERLDQYQRLKRKHQCQADELISIQQQLAITVAGSQDLEQQVAQQQQLVKALEVQLEQRAHELHRQRMDSKNSFEELVTAELAALNMPGAQILLQLEWGAELTSSGKTELKLFVQTNVGEGFHLVKDVASGGELSRLLLILRKLASHQGKVAIFLFDEIDTGVGGQTATVLGAKIKELSTSLQVLAITHLPQIAHWADQLVVVTKVIKKSSTTATGSEDVDVRTTSLVSYVQEVDQIKKEAFKLADLQH